MCKSCILTELKEPDVLQLVRDTFNASPQPKPATWRRSSIARPAAIALYVTQLLHFLCDEGLIAFDHRQRQMGLGPAAHSTARRDRRTFSTCLNLRLEGLAGGHAYDPGHGSMPRQLV